MKIRYLINNAYGGGGTIRTTLNMANALAERGHDVEVISLMRRRVDPVFEISDRVRVRVLSDHAAERTTAPWSRPVARAGDEVRRRLQGHSSRLLHQQDRRYHTYTLHTDVRLLQTLAMLGSGVVIATRPALNLALARFGRRSALRIGQEHLHLSRHEKKSELVDDFRRHYPRLDAITTLTRPDADAYRELLGPSARIFAMPNAVPDMGGNRARLDSKVVVAAGRLTAQKGFDLLIPAFAKVAAKHPDWKLRIFGGGDAHAALARQIDELALTDHVELAGFTQRLPEEMSRASIYALSSRFEGFPMVLLEAMLCGLPPVAFDCPTGPSDLIDHGHDGLVVPHRDVDALAGGIIELIEDEGRRRAMGEAAYRKAQGYTTPALAEKWEDLLTGIARERGLRV